MIEKAQSISISAYDTLGTGLDMTQLGDLKTARIEYQENSGNTFMTGLANGLGDISTVELRATGLGEEIITRNSWYQNSEGKTSLVIDYVPSNSKWGEGVHTPESLVSTWWNKSAPKLYTLSGDDKISGNNFADTLLGKGGNDLLNGNDGDDSISGGAGNDELFGGSGHDRLGGGSGNDGISGGVGNDKLFGGAGDDQLSGGAEADKLTGGSGRDTFIFRDGDARDVIKDFDVLNDTILIEASVANNFSDLDISSKANGNTIIRYNDNEDDVIVLKDVDVDTVDWFLFEFG